MNLKQVVDELIEERGIDSAVLDSIVCEGMMAAYQKKYPGVVFDVRYDHATGAVVVQAEKKVVAAVDDENQEISLKKARFISKDVHVDSTMTVPFEGSIGRIEILHARQIIANRIRAVEALSVYNEFKGKVNEVVHGTVHKCERGGMVVKLDETLAYLPASLSAPTDKCIVGMPIRALLKEVLSEPRNDHQIILERTSSLFLQRLLELEVPEIFERLIEIRKIVRAVGYKSKVVVASREKNIDPVGTCVGVGGARIKPIHNELGGEKIDVIQWSDIPEEMVKGSLKPAKINRVEIVDKALARVWLDEDQRSFAIGVGGQNISLASRLVGLCSQIPKNTRLLRILKKNGRACDN